MKTSKKTTKKIAKRTSKKATSTQDTVIRELKKDLQIAKKAIKKHAIAAKKSVMVHKKQIQALIRKHT